MRTLILTLAATATLFAGSLAMPSSADARPRGWGGGYYRAPAVRYYRPYRYYGGYYAPRRYYNYGYGNGYPYRYSWGGPGVYFRF